jgi:hypothetical protein
MDYVIVLAGVLGAIGGALTMWALKSRPEAFQGIDWRLVRDMVGVFVDSAEQIFQPGDNKQKFDYVTARLLEFLDERGWTNQFSEDMIKSLIESAVQLLP